MDPSGMNVEGEIFSDKKSPRTLQSGSFYVMVEYIISAGGIHGTMHVYHLQPAA